MRGDVVAPITKPLFGERLRQSERNLLHPNLLSPPVEGKEVRTAGPIGDQRSINGTQSLHQHAVWNLHWIEQQCGHAIPMQRDLRYPRIRITIDHRELDLVLDLLRDGVDLVGRWRRRSASAPFNFERDQFKGNSENLGGLFPEKSGVLVHDVGGPPQGASYDLFA